MIDDKLTDEPARLAALARYALDDREREPAFDKIVNLVKTVLGVPICAVMLVGREDAVIPAAAGVTPLRCAREQTICNVAIQGRNPMLVPDARIDPRFAATRLVAGEPHVVGYVGVPLATADGYNVGALCAIDTRPRAFTPAEVEILKGFAGLICDEIELRTIAQRDFLTGALTRRAFVEELGTELKRGERYGRPGSLIALDLDHFKWINDRHGHPAGDAVLAAAAAECQAMLRPSDRLGRLGGEEFAVLLPATRIAEALRCADRVRAAVERLRIPGFAAIRVTASFGVAERGGATPEGWIAEADAALYRAKAAGRNCCVGAWEGRLAA